MGVIASNRQAGSGEHGPAAPGSVRDNREKLLAEFQALGQELQMFREDLISYQARIRKILLDRGGEDA